MVNLVLDLIFFQLSFLQPSEESKTNISQPLLKSHSNTLIFDPVEPTPRESVQFKSTKSREADTDLNKDDSESREKSLEESKFTKLTAVSKVLTLEFEQENKRRIQPKRRLSKSVIASDFDSPLTSKSMEYLPNFHDLDRFSLQGRKMSGKKVSEQETNKDRVDLENQSQIVFAEIAYDNVILSKSLTWKDRLNLLEKRDDLSCTRLIKTMPVSTAASEEFSRSRSYSVPNLSGKDLQRGRNEINVLGQKLESLNENLNFTQSRPVRIRGQTISSPDKVIDPKKHVTMATQSFDLDLDTIHEDSKVNEEVF